MSVVFDRPYEFIPRHRGNWWPSFIKYARLADFYLAKKEGVVSIETRHAERLSASAKQGHGVIVAPNHCRYADPLVMAGPVRAAKLNFYAMASWHLFNKGKFDSFAMRKCGAFSLHREGTDRKSLDTAIEILSTAERPLLMFPEGMTFRTNDQLRPFLDGLSFIARTAARRRAKQVDGGKVVAHSMAIKYLCKIDCTGWAREQLNGLERHFCFRKMLKSDDLIVRTIRIADAMLAMSETEYLGAPVIGDPQVRCESLAHNLLSQAEANLGLTPADTKDIHERSRMIRSQVANQYFEADDLNLQRRLRDDAMCADLAQEYTAYSHNYLLSPDVTDTRVVETIQRLQERIYGKANRKIPLHCVIDIGEAIEIPAAKAPRSVLDPVLSDIHTQLFGMLERLAAEARPWPIR